MDNLDSPGRLDHIIDVIVELQDRQELLEHKIDEVVGKLTEKIMRLEDQLAKFINTSAPGESNEL